MWLNSIDIVNTALCWVVVEMSSLGLHWTADRCSTTVELSLQCKTLDHWITELCQGENSYSSLIYGSTEYCKKFHWFEWATPTFRGLIFLYIDAAKNEWLLPLATGFVLPIHIFHIISQVVWSFNVTLKSYLCEELLFLSGSHGICNKIITKRHFGGMSPYCFGNQF